MNVYLCINMCAPVFARVHVCVYVCMSFTWYPTGNAEPEAYFGLAQLLLDDGSVEASVEVLEETVSMLEGTVDVNCHNSRTLMY